MKIAFDASPLAGEQISGVGWCEANLIDAVTELHPYDSYRFEYFTLRHSAEKRKRLKPFAKGKIPLRPSFNSPFLYRAATVFLPVPYRLFFGDWADITHFFNYIVPPFVHGKTVVTVHDMVLHAYPETMRTRTRLLLQLNLKQSMKRADLIVTDSEFSRSEIAKNYPDYAHKVRVVPCGVDLKRFHPVHDPDEIARVQRAHQIPGDYFLYLGTLEPRKNLVRLIRAYAKLRERHETVPYLVLAGGKGWQYESIFAAVKRLGLEKYVLFPSYIPAYDMPALYSGAKAFLFPSLYEGFGMPPLEAMACGTPVLTSNAASLPEAVGDAALKVDPLKAGAILRGMEMLLTDKSLCDRLSKAGLARAQQMSWEHAAEKLYAVYREVYEL